MKSVWKFEVENNLRQEIQMPKGAKILHLGVKNDAPYLWAEVDMDAPSEFRTFEVFATGGNITQDMGIEREYIGTYMIFRETLVFHVYERIN